MSDRTRIQTEKGFEPFSTIDARQGTRFLDVSAATIEAKQDWQGFCVRFTNPAGCVVTVPATLPGDFSCGWSQETDGPVTFQPAAGATLQASGDGMKSAGKFALGGIAGWGEGAIRLYGELSV